MTRFFRTSTNRQYIAEVTRYYASLADSAKATDDPMSIVNLAFRELHESITTAFDLDTDTTPDRVIIAVYAHYTTHGGEATDMKLPSVACELSPYPAAWSTYPAAR